MTSQFERYQQNFATVEGFFRPEAQAAWDFFLSAQNAMNVTGDFVEIGVWKGKSAILGALYLRSDETATLVDIHDPIDAERMIASLKVPKVLKFVGESREFPYSQSFKETSLVRWFHIDGDHSGFSTTADLEIASRMLATRGLICVDDFFNPRYPQLAASVYRFLFSKSTFRLVLCGANKAFICHAADYALYESLIRKFLPGHMASLSMSVTIAKTSYAHDFGCFAIEGRHGDQDIVGRDEDKDDIVF